MESSLKFTEGSLVLFDVDSIFQRKMKKYPQNVIHDIVSIIVDNILDLPKQDYYHQKVYGVLKMKVPLFFCITYINENDDVPILIDIEEVLVDDYLDAINDNKHFKNNG